MSRRVQAQPLTWLAATRAMPALLRLSLSSCLLGRQAAAAIAQQCREFSVLSLQSSTVVLADGVGTAWAGPDELPRLMSLSWGASPPTFEFDVVAELSAILCGRRLSHLQLSPEDERRAAKEVVDERFVRRVLGAMPAQPISCELPIGPWDGCLVRVLVGGPAAGGAPTTALNLPLPAGPASALGPLVTHPCLRELHLQMWGRASAGAPVWPPSWPPLIRLAIVGLNLCHHSTALVRSLASSVARATLSTLDLRRFSEVLTEGQSRGDLARLAALRSFTVSCSAIFLTIFRCQDSTHVRHVTEVEAFRHFHIWAARALQTLNVCVQ